MKESRGPRLVPIEQVRLNPKNPRVIKDEDFRQLVHSIQTFPKMLRLRPIVVDEHMMALGGNRRLEACIEAGRRDVWIMDADDLTPEEQQQFIIRDNVLSGQWDWKALAEDWDLDNLKEWGVDLPDFDEPDYADRNEEVNVDEIEDKMTIKLTYTEAEYYQVKEQLAKIAGTPEQAVWILLGNE